MKAFFTLLKWWFAFIVVASIVGGVLTQIAEMGS